MNSEQASDSKPSPQYEISSKSSKQVVKEAIDEEDPFSLSGTSIALFGLAMAVTVVGLPLLVVITDRPLGRESLFPNTFKSDGSKPPPPISLTRFGKSRR